MRNAALYIDIGRVVYQFYRRRALQTTARLIRTGVLLPVWGSRCHYCGGPATVYEHRDYGQPEVVVPACDSCNHRLAPAALDLSIVLKELANGLTYEDLSCLQALVGDPDRESEALPSVQERSRAAETETLDTDPIIG